MWIDILKVLKLDEYFWKEKHCFEYCHKFPISLLKRQPRGKHPTANLPRQTGTPLKSGYPPAKITLPHKLRINCKPGCNWRLYTWAWLSASKYWREAHVRERQTDQPQLSTALVTAGSVTALGEKGNGFYFSCVTSGSNHGSAQESQETMQYKVSSIIMLFLVTAFHSPHFPPKTSTRTKWSQAHSHIEEASQWVKKIK